VIVPQVLINEAVSMRRFLIAMVSVALTASSAASQSITAGVGTTGNCYPFFCYQDGARYQQIYSASLFPGVYDISRLSFFISAAAPSYAFTGQTFDVYLTTTSRPVDGLSSIFDDNVGPDRTEFATFSPTGPATSVFSITGDTPFAYDPSTGNLLLDVIAHGDNPNGPPTYVDADQNDPDLSRVYFLTASTVGMTDESRDLPVIGLVTRFDEAPEPAPVVLLATGIIGVVGIAGRRSGRLRVRRLVG
jgi:hypothetical protein